LAEAVIPKGKAYFINQAMMDFGATVCTARAPQCSACVLRRRCRSYPFDPVSKPGRANRAVRALKSR